MARIYLLLLLLLSSIYIVIASYQCRSHCEPVVLDSNGDPLLTGVQYYIQPLSPAGTTIGLSSAPNRTCPLDVVQQTPTAGGALLPVKFSSVRTDGFIISGAPTNIIFNASTICVTSTVWRIQTTKTTTTNTTYFVEIGGVEGNLGIKTLDNWFGLLFGHSDQGGYVINFCPNDICMTCKPAVCGNIGLIVDNDGRTRLGITSGGAPFLVKFVKTGF